ncbi:response regulator [Streptococcus pneumoniae]|nr:response regulator [Streptococcus pneumoniae]
MKVLILEDVIEHQVRLERILDEISKESNIPISYKTTGKAVNLKNTLKMMK